jgi:hypothetical protein
MATNQPGHDVVTTTVVQLIGISVFAIFAGMSDDLGTVMVVVMWGIVLGWFLLHTSDFAKVISPITSGNVKAKDNG